MNSALLCVDLQNDYFPGGRAELVQPELAAQQAKLAIDFFRAKQWPVFHVRHINNNINAAFFASAGPGSEIYQLVAPLAAEAVIVKHKPNSFYETDLAERLRAGGIDSLIICGMMSHMCIDSTVRAARELGFSVTVLQDACATRNLTWQGEAISAAVVHAVFMAALQGSFARVIQTQELFSLLS